MKVNWTPEEEIFLSKNYPTQGIKYCSNILNRSHQSILRKAQCMNIKSLKETRLLRRKNTFTEKFLNEYPLEQQCKKCKIIYPYTEKYFDRQNNGSIARLRSACIQCKRNSSLKHYYGNKELHLQQNKIWIKNNPEKRKEQKLKSERKRRAAKINVNENYSENDAKITFNIFNNQCFNCGLKDNLCIDHHRPLSKGNPLTMFNAVILCKSCNSLKGTKDPEIFYGKKKCKKLDAKLKNII